MSLIIFVLFKINVSIRVERKTNEFILLLVATLIVTGINFVVLCSIVVVLIQTQQNILDKAEMDRRSSKALRGIIHLA